MDALKKACSRFFPFILIILLGIAIYSNSLQCSFQFDDLEDIVHNYSIKDLSDPVAILMGNPPTRFIGYLSLALNYRLGGLEVAGYHIFNIAVHLLNAACVYWLAVLIFALSSVFAGDSAKNRGGEEGEIKGSPATPDSAKIFAKTDEPGEAKGESTLAQTGHKQVSRTKVRGAPSPEMPNAPDARARNTIALFAALIFLSHPVQTQAVTYIVQRLASMATLFYLLTVCLYIKGRLAGQGRSGRVWLSLAACTAVLGMLTKETTATLPFMVILVELWFFKKERARWKYITVVSLFLLLIPVLRVFNVQGIFLSSFESQSYSYEEVTSINYLLTQFGVIIRYIQLLFVPIGQNFDYDLTLSKSLLEPKTLASLLVLAGLALAAYKARKKEKFIAFAAFWFFITLSVESSIIPIPNLIFEHRVYLPSVGFSLLAAYGLYRLLTRPRAYIAVMCLWVAVLSFLTVQRNKVYKDEVTLWSDVIAKSPRKARAYTNRAMAYERSKEYDKALADVNTSIGLDPKYAESFTTRGLVHKHKRMYQQALDDYNKALEINPLYHVALNNRGFIYAQAGMFDLALADFNKAIGQKKDFDKAYNNRGNIYEHLKQYPQALADYSKAIELDPDYAEPYYNRGNIFVSLGDLKAAAEEYHRVIGLDADFAEAYHNLGYVYNVMGEQEAALKNFSLAIEKKSDYPIAYFSRSNLLKDLNRLNEALADALMARQLGFPVDEGYVSMLKIAVGSQY